MQILGTGCPKCRALTANAEKAILTARLMKAATVNDAAATALDWPHEE